MVIVVLSAILVAVVLVEMLLMVTRSTGLRSDLASLVGLLQEFNGAPHDEARQQLITRAGTTILKVSLQAIVVILVSLGLVAIPPYYFGWRVTALLLYTLLLSLLSFVWWLSRMKFHKARAEVR